MDEMSAVDQAKFADSMSTGFDLDTSCLALAGTCLSLATPGFRRLAISKNAPVAEELGSGARGRASDNLIRGATFAPRRCSCLPTGSSALAANLGGGPDLRAHHPARIPFADRPGTVPSTLIRFMTRVPAREMRWIMRESERAWTNLFFKSAPTGYFSRASQKESATRSM